MAGNPIKLVSKSKDTVQFDHRITTISNFVGELAEEYYDTPIFVYMIDTGSLNHIKDYCKLFNYNLPGPIPKPLTVRFSSATSSQENSFFSGIELQDVCTLLEAADLLGIDRLVEGCCAYIAHEFQTRHPEYLRERFGFPDDYNNMEENLMTNYNWLFEN